MTAYAILRTPSGPVRFRVNTDARDDEPVLAREDEMKKTLGHVAYEAWCASMYQDADWDALSCNERNAWHDAATAVHSEVLAGLAAECAT